MQLVKRRLDPEEIPMDLVSNDITNKLKLAVLHQNDAKELQGSGTALLEYYTLSGNVVVGPYPRSKGKKLFFFVQPLCNQHLNFFFFSTIKKNMFFLYLMIK